MDEQQMEQIKVRIDDDGMAAYLNLKFPENGAPYAKDDVMDVLAKRGVSSGIKEDVIDRMLEEQLFGREEKIAAGTPAVDGIDGRFQFHFDTEPKKKPKIKADGSADYWTMSLVQKVKKGDVVADYVGAVQGQNGKNVRGETVLAKIGRELPPLKGRGLDRDEDSDTYRASVDGKVEMINDRVQVSNILEFSSDVDNTVGSIDFSGDVVVHGNVMTGMRIRAKGSITIDGNVESVQLEAGKDIVLRSGMQGGKKACIISSGNVFAKFIEYTEIKVKGNLEANSLLNCEVQVQGRILLNGKGGAVVGGSVEAIQGIQAMNLGNKAGIKTLLLAGVRETVYQRYKEVKERIAAKETELRKVEHAIELMERKEAVGAQRINLPSKVDLLRLKIKDTSELAKANMEVKELERMIQDSKGAFIRVERFAYPNLTIIVNGIQIQHKEEQFSVEFRKHRGNVLMERIAE